MSLRRIISKSAITVLGINSGTSADALDMAIVRITRTRGRVKVEPLDTTEKRFSPKLRSLVFRSADSRTTNIDEIIYLDGLLGKTFGRAATNYMKKLTGRGVKVDLVASHGQTIRHLPKKKKYGGCWINGTMQLGSPDMIAAMTGVPVVGEFRQADIAVGNEGAPITVGAMHRLFACKNESRLIVNIGGMSNYFYFPGSKSSLPVSASDCGPGNCLSDILADELYSERYDRGGRRAASGELSTRLLTLLMGDPFFTSRISTTGRESFGPNMVQMMVDFGNRFGKPNEDLLRTAAELTTNAIARKVWPVVRRDGSLSKLHVSGGGRHNNFFMKRLKHHLPDLDILPVDELGYNAESVEAIAYAVMGEACLRSEPLSSAGTGTSNRNLKTVLGRIAQPPTLDRKQRSRS